MDASDWAEMVAQEILSVRATMWLDADEKSVLSARIATALRTSRAGALKEAAAVAEDAGDASDVNFDHDTEAAAVQQVSSDIAQSILALRRRSPEEGAPGDEGAAFAWTRSGPRRGGLIEGTVLRRDVPQPVVRPSAPPSRAAPTGRTAAYAAEGPARGWIRAAQSRG